MSDEEKEAIEELKGIYMYVGGEGLEKNIKVVLNLIEKQAREIEELKAISEYRKKIIKGLGLKTLPKTITGFKELLENNDKKWEEKIKAKIEEIDNTGIDVAWEQVNYINR